MNKVQHFEIPADDIARARKFYESAFEWKTADWPMPGMTYVGLHTGELDEQRMPKEAGFINGGMFQRGDTQFIPTGPTIAVTTPDLAATIEKVKAGGGTVLGEPINIGGMGLYVYVKDTEGNTIGVWQDIKK